MERQGAFAHSSTIPSQAPRISAQSATRGKKRSGAGDLAIDDIGGRNTSRNLSLGARPGPFAATLAAFPSRAEASRRAGSGRAWWR